MVSLTFSPAFITCHITDAAGLHTRSFINSLLQTQSRLITHFVLVCESVVFLTPNRCHCLQYTATHVFVESHITAVQMLLWWLLRKSYLAIKSSDSSRDLSHEYISQVSVPDVYSNFVFFSSPFQLQDCIQATLSDWFTNTKLPSEVGRLSNFFLCSCFTVLSALTLCVL